MKQKGETAESIRELIEVPAEIREKLMVFATEHPEERPEIELMLRFRTRVAEEFERLIACGQRAIAASNFILDYREKSQLLRPL